MTNLKIGNYGVVSKPFAYTILRVPSTHLYRTVTSGTAYYMFPGRKISNPGRERRRKDWTIDDIDVDPNPYSSHLQLHQEYFIRSASVLAFLYPRDPVVLGCKLWYLCSLYRRLTCFLQHYNTDELSHYRLFLLKTKSDAFSRILNLGELARHIEKAVVEPSLPQYPILDPPHARCISWSSLEPPLLEALTLFFFIAFAYHLSLGLKPWLVHSFYISFRVSSFVLWQYGRSIEGYSRIGLALLAWSWNHSRPIGNILLRSWLDLMCLTDIRVCCTPLLVTRPLALSWSEYHMVTGLGAVSHLWKDGVHHPGPSVSSQCQMWCLVLCTLSSNSGGGFEAWHRCFENSLGKSFALR